MAGKLGLLVEASVSPHKGLSIAGVSSTTGQLASPRVSGPREKNKEPGRTDLFNDLAWEIP